MCIYQIIFKPLLQIIMLRSKSTVLKGGLLVSGSYSNIKIRDVEGDLRVESHFGQVELANVNGDVALLSSLLAV